MAEPEDKFDSKELEEVRFIPPVCEKGGAATDLPPQEIAAVLALFELLGTWEEGKRDSLGNES